VNHPSIARKLVLLAVLAAAAAVAPGAARAEVVTASPAPADSDEALLAAALVETAPRHLDFARASQHARAALAAAQGTEVDPFLLLGMAYIESRYDRRAVSRLECDDPRDRATCSRVASLWKRRSKPRSFAPPYFCGVLQVGGWISWRGCMDRVDDLEANYREAALHLQRWLEQPICKRRGAGRLRCALLGYGGGYKLIAGGSTYPRRCMAQARKLRTVIDRRESVSAVVGRPRAWAMR